MAAPTPTATGTPDGLPLEDPFPTVLVFSLLPTASFWEHSVTPSSVDGGEPLRRTNMRNIFHHTKAPRTLIEHGDVQANVFFDPNLWNQIVTSLVNRKGGSATVRKPDGSTWCAWAYLRSIVYQGITEGEQMPTADLTVVVTNWDAATNTENGPVVTSVSGT